MQMFAIPDILQENFHLAKMTLSPKSIYSGKRIIDTDFRDNFNISVVGVDRAGEQFDLPDKDFQLFPYDKITFIGTEEHTSALKARIEVEDETFIREAPESDVEIYKMEIKENSRFKAVSLMDSELSSRYEAMVIAVERNSDFILNPSPRICFNVGDLVWFVSSKAAAKRLLDETV